MNWIKIDPQFVRFGLPEGLPRNGDIFLAIWRGQICLCQYDEDEGRFYMSDQPAYNNVWELSQNREHKFEYWMPLDFPKDYLDDIRSIENTFEEENGN